MQRFLAACLGTVCLGMLSFPAVAAPAQPVIHVGLSGGAGPVLVATQGDTTGFSWSVELDGDAPGIGESGLGFREMRLYRKVSVPAQAYTALFRQVRLRSSVWQVPQTPLMVSWQGGVILQDFQKGGVNGKATGLTGVTENMLGGELGLRLDWHPLPMFAPYVAVGGMYGGLVDPSTAVPTTTTTASSANVAGFDAQLGVASRWPITVTIGDDRYNAQIGGKAELYWWNLFSETLVGLDFRVGTYF